MAIPKKGTKRAAASSVDARKKQATTTGDCKIVAKALVGNPMLACVVKQTLGVYADERHEFQAKLVVMIGEALATLEASLDDAVRGAQAAVDGAGAEKASREQAMADAEVDLKAKEEALVAAEAAFSTDTEAAHSAAAAVKSAESTQKASDASVASAKQMKDELGEAQAKFLQMKEAPGSASDVKSVVKVIGQCRCDGQVLVYAPETLKKEPGSRGQFDTIIIKTIEETLEAKFGEITQVLVGAAEEAAAQAVEVANAAHTAAVEKKEASKTARDEAADALKAAKAALKDARASIASYETDMKSAEKELGLAVGKKNSFVDGALFSYNALKDKVKPSPEPEQPEAPTVPEETAQSAATEGVSSGATS